MRRPFAAPLVIVVACAAPQGPAAPEPEEPIHANPPPVTEYRAARPGEVAPPPTPAPAPPPPSPPPSPPKEAFFSNPPRPMALDVVAVVVAGPAVVLTFGGGSDDGVQAGLRGVLIDDHDRPIRGSDFVLFDVDRHAAHARVKLAPAAIPPDARAKVTMW